MRRALRFIAVFVGLVIVVLAGLFVALSLIPDDVYRGQITAAVKAQTGRELTIAGDINVTVFPRIGVEAHGVSLANAPGFSAPALATMERLAVGVDVVPILSGEIRFTEFALIRPEIALEVDRQGARNWQFEPEDRDHHDGPDERDRPSADDDGNDGNGPELRQLSLGTVRLTDGQVSYANRQTGQDWTARDINLAVEMQSLDAPIKVDGRVVWNDEPLSLTLNASAPRKFGTPEGSALDLRLQSKPIRAEFDGRVATADGQREPDFNGTAALDIPSMRALSAWLGEPMAEGDGFGPLTIKGKVSANAKIVRFDDAEIRFDNTRGTGALKMESRDDKPYVKASLVVDALDLEPYLDGSPSPASSSGQAGQPAATAGWSAEPVDLSALKQADADLDFRADSIQAQGMTINDGTLTVALKDGIATATLNAQGLYGGRGTAKFRLDGRRKAAEIAADVALSAITIEPLLKDAAAFDRLTGTGDLVFALKSRGDSQKAWVDGLNGTGSIKLVDGAIRGIDLASMVRNLAGAFGEAATGDGQKTDFAEFGGSFVVTNGVLRNDDLLLLNPLLRITGAGSADLSRRTLDYRLTPKAVASIEGQGGRSDLTGVSVPVRVSGSWDALKFAPDQKGLLEGATKGLGEALEAGEDPLKGALRGVLGRPGVKPVEGDPAGEQAGGDGTGQTGAAQTEPAEVAPQAKPKDPAELLLERVFKRPDAPSEPAPQP